jgi:hypothetical protein
LRCRCSWHPPSQRPLATPWHVACFHSSRSSRQRGTCGIAVGLLGFEIMMPQDFHSADLATSAFLRFRLCASAKANLHWYLFVGNAPFFCGRRSEMRPSGELCLDKSSHTRTNGTNRATPRNSTPMCRRTDFPRPDGPSTGST